MKAAGSHRYADGGNRTGRYFAGTQGNGNQGHDDVEEDESDANSKAIALLKTFSTAGTT